MQTLERETETYSTPTPKLWTVEECDALQKMGFIEGHYELIEGIIVDKMGQNGTHSRLICALVNALLALFGGEKARTQLPVHIKGELGRTNEPLPDVAVTKESYRIYKENPQPQDMILVAEVSDTSLRFDMNTKAMLYARAEVAEYWVLDANGRRLIVHREPTTEGYASITAWEEGESVAPLATPTSFVAVTNLFE